MTTKSVAANLMSSSPWAGHMYAGGRRKSQNGVANITDKATNQILTTVATASIGDVRDACAAAVTAGQEWAAVSIEDRAAIMSRAGEILDGSKNEIFYWIVREAGSTRFKAQREVQTSKDCLDHAAALTSAPLREELKDDAGMLSYAIRVPVGVVGVIGPFNFPLSLGLRMVAPALAMGNAVVLKPSLDTAVSGGILVARIFEEAGLPKGVLQVLPGGDEAGVALVEDPNVSMIAFTGSSAVGRRIGAAAGAMLKRTSLELGGKNPFIVLPDADVEAAARAGAFSAFFNQGQVCVAAGIHFVHETLFDRYAARVAELAKAIKVGDPFKEEVGLGPLISDKQRDRVHAIVQDAIHAGAELLEGGSFTGNFYRPTVLTKVSQTSRAFKEEIFGPVAVIVSFREESEAIELANKNEYGLAASVFGEEEHARNIGEQIETGILHINDVTAMNDVNARFGGMKASGNLSRFGGHSDVEEYTTWKWITETHRPVPYEIPSAW